MPGSWEDDACLYSAPGLVTRTWRWLDRMSKPQENTRGDFDKPAYSQAVLNGSIEGFALGGIKGAIVALQL